MKEKYPPLFIIVLILSLAGCALIPDQPPSLTPTPAIPPSGYEPQPGDAKLRRDKVFLDVENSRLVVGDEPPVKARLTLIGNLSDPCHQLRVVVTPANANNEINLDVYSVFDPGVACITVLKPFDATIPLGIYNGGHFTIFVNGDFVGEFDA